MSGEAISALPSAVTPLSGAEVIPLVQSGVTRQAAVNAIAAAPTAFAYAIQSASFAGVWGSRFGLNTASAPITVTLPAASISNAMEVADLNHNANTNHITLTATSPNQIVYGVTTATNQTVSVNGAVVRLVCYATNRIRALVIASA